MPQSLQASDIAPRRSTCMNQTSTRFRNEHVHKVMETVFHTPLLPVKDHKLVEKSKFSLWRRYRRLLTIHFGESRTSNDRARIYDYGISCIVIHMVFTITSMTLEVFMYCYCHYRAVIRPTSSDTHGASTLVSSAELCMDRCTLLQSWGPGRRL